MANNLNFQKRVLYKLKQEYGDAVDLYIESITSANYTTGSKNTTRTKYAIKRAIVAPFKMFTQGIYSPAYIKEAKEFTYGAYQDQDIKTVVIDVSDLPKNIEITPQNYLIIKNLRYEIANVVKMENNLGYILIVKRLTGTEPYKIIDQHISQTLRVTHGVTK